MTNFLFVSWPSGYYFRMLFKDLKKLTMIPLREQVIGHLSGGFYDIPSRPFGGEPSGIS